MRKSLLLAMAVILAAFAMASCGEKELYEVHINAECKATDANGGAITELNLVSGQKVKWCNDTEHEVNIEFSVVGIVPSGVRLVLGAGASEKSEIADSVEPGAYNWIWQCQARGGSGGGPVKVDPPCNTPPCD